MPKKIQITLTLTDEAAQYIKDMAEIEYEGNVSMAIRKVIADHSQSIGNKLTNP